MTETLQQKIDAYRGFVLFGKVTDNTQGAMPKKIVNQAIQELREQIRHLLITPDNYLYFTHNYERNKALRDVLTLIGEKS